MCFRFHLDLIPFYINFYFRISSECEPQLPKDCGSHPVNLVQIEYISTSNKHLTNKALNVLSDLRDDFFFLLTIPSLSSKEALRTSHSKCFKSQVPGQATHQMKP